MRALYLLLFVLSCAGSAMAQSETTVRLSGVVLDTLNNPVEYVTISILSVDSSTLTSRAITDSAGRFTLTDLPKSRYYVRINDIQYDPIQMYVELDDSKELDPIIIRESIYMIGETVVKANFIKRQAGTYVVSFKGNPITKGKSLHQTLGLLPGVSTYSGLSINGVSGTQVYINGRKIRDEKELEAIQAINIDSVEVVFNTGSLYDAQLKGGRINIALEKRPQGGFWGTIGTSVTLRPKFGLGADNAYAVVNYGYKGLNIYNYASYGDFRTIAEYDITSFYRATADSLFLSTKEQGWSHTFRDNLSVAYELNKKHTIGVNVELSTETSDPKTTSRSIRKNSYQPTTEHSLSEITGQHNNFQYQAAFNYDWIIDNRGSNIKLIADYLANNNIKKQHYTYPQNEDNSSVQQLMRDKLNNKTKTFEVDGRLELHLGKHALLSSGLRYYDLSIDRLLNYDDFANNSWSTNTDLSDNFKVSGRGYAGYADLSSSSGGFSWSAGLRVQQDNIDHNSYKMDKTVKKNFFNLFPSASFGYSKNGLVVNTSYSRGIGYIPYNEISPAVTYHTEYSYTKGNPDLNLTIDNTFQLSLSLKKWSIYYDYIYSGGDIYYFTFIDGNNPLVTYSMPLNTGTTHFHIAGVSRNVQIAKWWQFYGNIYLRSRRVYYPEDGINKALHSTAIFCDISNDFSINKNFGGFINFHGETSEKIDDKIKKPVYGISVGAYGYFLDKKITLRLTSQPVISKLRDWEVNKVDYWSYNRYRTSQMNFRISLSYNFKTGQSRDLKQAQKIQFLEERSEAK